MLAVFSYRHFAHSAISIDLGVILPYFSCSAMLWVEFSCLHTAWISQSRVKRARMGPGTLRSGEAMVW